MNRNPIDGHGISRQVELTSRSTERPLSITQLKYIDNTQLKLLMPLDANGEVIEYAPHEEVTLKELCRGAPHVVHDTHVLEVNIPHVNWGNLLVLAQPQDNPVRKRQFLRVDTVFPVSFEVMDTHEKMEGLATNLSAGGVLLTVTEGDVGKLRLGMGVSVELNLPDDEVFAFRSTIRRMLRTKKEGKTFHAIAVAFEIENPTEQDALVRYVLTRDIELRTLDLVKEELPVHKQLEECRQEVARLREELRLAHERESQAAEARRRSDAIIMQLTRQLDEQTRRLVELQSRRRYPRWQFWKRWKL